MNATNDVLQVTIDRKIYLLRSQKVMLSYDLATLYVVEPRVLVQMVRRNIERFPKDFMFQLTKQEYKALKSHNFVLSWGGTRTLPYAFTEQGVAMLSSVLRSKRAIQVNIAIMRAFVKLRQILSTHKELAEKLAELEAAVAHHDEKIKVIFEVIRQLMEPKPEPSVAPEKPPIGFR